MTRFQACPEAGKVSLGTYLCRKFAGVTVLLWLLEVAYSNPNTALVSEMVLRHIDTHYFPFGRRAKKKTKKNKAAFLCARVWKWQKKERNSRYLQST